MSEEREEVMGDVFSLGDDLGPTKVVHILRPAVGLKAILVIDNVAAGPSIGGVRMAPDASLQECARLARAMTLKNAAAGLPHGGGKAVIIGDPAMDRLRYETLVRAFAQAIQDETGYIAGPDMGTNERCMAWILDEIGRAVGLPSELGGIPLDEIGVTAFGLAVAAEAAENFGGVPLKGARIAVQGFGAVGLNAARSFMSRGAALVAASDSRGCVMDAGGLDVEALVELKRGGGALTDHPAERRADRDDVIAADCDILIPAARPDVINEDNVDRIRARMVIEGANIPATVEAECSLQERGVMVLPDFVVNAGGVICAAVEYRGGTEAQAFAAAETLIRENVEETLKRAATQRCGLRDAAIAMATERVRAAQRYRRFERREGGQ